MREYSVDMEPNAMLENDEIDEDFPPLEDVSYDSKTEAANEADERIELLAYESGINFTEEEFPEHDYAIADEQESHEDAMVSIQVQNDWFNSGSDRRSFHQDLQEPGY